MEGTKQQRLRPEKWVNDIFAQQYTIKTKPKTKTNQKNTLKKL